MGCVGSKPAAIVPSPRSPTPAPRAATPPPPRAATPPPPRAATPPPPPDGSSVEIQTDTGKDEVQIPTVEENYPAAAPTSTNDEIGPTTAWFDSGWEEGGPNLQVNEELFGSDWVDEEEISLGVESVNATNIKKGSPVQKTLPKISLTEIDDHARSADAGLLSSFEVLLGYLTKHIQGHRHRELLTARAIVVWMSKQDIDGTSYGPLTKDTPAGLLQYLKQGKMTYATCYTILCRHAGLVCVLIKGVVKAAGYEPGDTDTSNISCNWTAVYVEKSWQIVHPFWICRALYGHNLGGWTKVESDGKSMSTRQHASEGVVKNAFQEHYFMPKPSAFVYKCYADDTAWQLLPPEKRVRSRADFMRLPYLLTPFFGVDLELISEHKCELLSENGICKVQFRGNKQNAHKLTLLYDLYLKDTGDSDNKLVQKNNLPRLVFNSRNNEIFTFEVRFPIEGVFKLVIYGGPHGSASLRLCEFKLVCKQRLSNCKLLPKKAGIEGWGPGPVAELKGLFLPTKPNGIIPITAKTDGTEPFGKPKTVDVKFQLSRDLIDKTDYKVEILGSDSADTPEPGLDKYVSSDVNKELAELTVKASIPTQGEYALVIMVGRLPPEQKGRGSKPPSTYSVACNYLLSSQAQPIRLTTPQRLAKTALIEAMNSRRDVPLKQQMQTLGSALEKCLRAKLNSTDDEVGVAQTWYDFLEQKNALRDCHMRRNLSVTNKSLMVVMKYRYQVALLPEIQRVTELRSELIALRGFTRKIPGLHQAGLELSHLVNASPEVLATMRALFVLVEGQDAAQNEWHVMKSQLAATRTEKEGNIFKKMDDIASRHIDGTTKAKIQHLLSNFDEEKVRHSSQAAASFYIWVRDVTRVTGKAPKRSNS